MKDLINKMNDEARQTWNKIRESLFIDDNDETYLQWKEEIMEVRSEGGDDALCTICDMHGIEVYALETLLWHAFE